MPSGIHVLSKPTTHDQVAGHYAHQPGITQRTRQTKHAQQSDNCNHGDHDNHLIVAPAGPNKVI